MHNNKINYIFEEYMKNSPPEPYQTPFTPCWCETRPNNPNCTQKVSIDSDFFVVFTVVFILLLTFKK